MSLSIFLYTLSGLQMLEETEGLVIFLCNLMLLFLFHDDSVSKACINRCYIWLTIKVDKCDLLEVTKEENAKLGPFWGSDA